METLLSKPLPKFPTDWSRDGKYLLFGLLTEATKSDIWALSMADRHTAPVLDTISSEGYAALSPDGKWMAYQSDESGRNQVYVQPFDGIAGEPGGATMSRPRAVAVCRAGAPMARNSST
jgi:Tol biopolymer transport system component